MLARNFRYNTTGGIILAPIIIGIIWSNAFMNPSIAVLNNNMPLYGLLINGLKSMPPILIPIITCLLILGQSIYLNIIVAKHEVLYRRTNLPLLVYPLIMGLFSEFTCFHPILIVNSILLVVLDLSLNLYKSRNAIATQFNIGTLLALASIVYFPAVMLILLLWINLLLLRPFAWREWIAGIFGLGVLFVFYFLFLFWNDLTSLIFKTHIDPLLNTNIAISFPISSKTYILLSLFAFTLFISALKISANFNKNVIKTRSYQKVVGAFLFTSCASVILCSQFNVLHITILAIPASILIAYYFLFSTSRIWVEFLLLVIMAAMFVDRLAIPMPF